VDEGDFRAYVRIVFDDCFAVHELKIVRRPAGLMIARPSRNLGHDVFLGMAFPVNTETRNWIEARVLREYATVLTADPPRKQSGQGKIER
jgi:stage V sporulation protein G